MEAFSERPMFCSMCERMAEAGPADGKRCGAGCRGSSLWVVLPFAEGVGCCKFAKAFTKRSLLTPYRWASDGAHSVSEAARRL